MALSSKSLSNVGRGLVGGITVSKIAENIGHLPSPSQLCDERAGNDAVRLPECPAKLASSTSGRVYAIVNLSLLLVLLGGVALAASLQVTPENEVRVPWLNRTLPSTCSYLAATGQPCPSCGITRSLISATHGNWERSGYYHPAGMAILVMVLAQCGMRLAFLWSKLRSPAIDIAVSASMLPCFVALVNRW